MQFKKVAIILSLSMLLISCSNSGNLNSTANNNEVNNEQHTNELHDDTLAGALIPTIQPKLFAPGIISLEASKEVTSTYASYTQEFYFAKESISDDNSELVIWVSHIDDDQWTDPEMISFASIHKDFNPYITPDNTYLLFYRMEKFSDRENRNGTFVSERTENGWSDPEFLIDEYCVTTLDMITFYFSPIKGNNKDSISSVMYPDDEYISNSLLGTLNSDYLDLHPIISPLGDYVIFDSNRPGGFTNGDMYISFKSDDNTWGDAINLGPEINSDKQGQPSISSDGSLLFFSRNDDIWWVSLDFIETLRPE